MTTPTPTSKGPPGGWRPWLIATAISVLTLIAVALSTPWLRPTSEPSVATASVSPSSVVSPSIVVLPFVDQSSENPDQGFSAGFSEDLRRMLARAPALHVAGHTSPDPQKWVDLPRLGQQLNVTTALKGSVRRSGNQILVTAQLVDVADGRQRWFRAFERDSADVAAIQQQIAAAVLAELKVEAPPPERPNSLDDRNATRGVQGVSQRGTERVQLREGTAASFSRA